MSYLKELKPKKVSVSLAAIVKAWTFVRNQLCRHRKLTFMGYKNDGYNEEWSEWECKTCKKIIEKD
jgi:hypothetical protein